MWGAARSVAIVAIMVNAVKKIKHNLSSTIAANFQSFSNAAESSSSLILSVITLSSFNMRLNSLMAPGGKLGSSLSDAEEFIPGSEGRFPALGALQLLGPLVGPLVPILFIWGGWVCEGWWGWMWLECGNVEEGLKSSSMSSTLASRLFDDLSFRSSSFILFCIIMVFLVIFSPGRPMRSAHGIHCRKMHLTHGGISCVSANLWW